MLKRGACSGRGKKEAYVYGYVDMIFAIQLLDFIFEFMNSTHVFVRLKLFLKAFHLDMT
jgi:hypothetical protein